MDKKAFQEYYAPEFSHCFGCGCANPHGLHVKSYWKNEAEGETIAYFSPEPHHTGGYPGFVYGGLIAAILDCHGNGTAAAAGYRHAGRGMDTLPALRYVTANLNINYKAPTPMGSRLELRGKIMDVTDRKVCMELSVIAEGRETVSATMISVLLPQKSSTDK
ncbi:PaaI family thioesterase [Porphyromonas sp.]|uniref:PaaI family thioesterase n=1 Tax=Porphyromonas sp. TaxID=1924944 RepID=UPI0026DA958C|nr:PaaI family thioesterase [Porphyromonas sp.]MDO4695351.1 PaaI family thioesterase [Porphyromonas sp.]MDO4770352.1 PaaI family thioesterase [Porphyromonas sp.]